MFQKIRKFVVFLLAISLALQQAGYAQPAPNYFAAPGSLSPDKFRPIHLRYLSFNPEENNFQLLLDKGDEKNPTPLAIQDTTKILMDYFRIGLTLPDKCFWVNLRPDAQNNIIDPELEKTDIGRILLEADLNLKKDLALFSSPQTPEGRQYWDKLYGKAEALFGEGDVSLPTFTRPWIVPGEIIVRQTKESAYVYKATLKVMLEQDYFKDAASYNFEDERLKELNDYSSKLIRTLIIPKLTREVNTSRRYAPLRQVYYSLILAQWFKQNFQNQANPYAALIDGKQLNGLTSKTTWSKLSYFNQYKQSFEKGEYSQTETINTLYGQTIRQYTSGGINFGQAFITTQAAKGVQATGAFPRSALPWGLPVSVRIDGSPFKTVSGAQKDGGAEKSTDAGAVEDVERRQQWLAINKRSAEIQLPDGVGYENLLAYPRIDNSKIIDMMLSDDFINKSDLNKVAVEAVRQIERRLLAQDGASILPFVKLVLAGDDLVKQEIMKFSDVKPLGLGGRPVDIGILAKMVEDGSEDAAFALAASSKHADLGLSQRKKPLELLRDFALAGNGSARSALWVFLFDPWFSSPDEEAIIAQGLGISIDQLRKKLMEEFNRDIRQPGISPNRLIPARGAGPNEWIEHGSGTYMGRSKQLIESAVSRLVEAHPNQKHFKVIWWGLGSGGDASHWEILAQFLSAGKTAEIIGYDIDNSNVYRQKLFKNTIYKRYSSHFYYDDFFYVFGGNEQKSEEYMRFIAKALGAELKINDKSGKIISKEYRIDVPQRIQDMVRFAQGDITCSDELAGNYDLIIARSVLWYVNPRHTVKDKIVRDTIKHLAPGGIFIFDDQSNIPEEMPEGIIREMGGKQWITTVPQLVQGADFQTVKLRDISGQVRHRKDGSENHVWAYMIEKNMSEDGSSLLPSAPQDGGRVKAAGGAVADNGLKEANGGNIEHSIQQLDEIYGLHKKYLRSTIWKNPGAIFVKTIKGDKNIILLTGAHGSEEMMEYCYQFIKNKIREENFNSDEWILLVEGYGAGLTSYIETSFLGKLAENFNINIKDPLEGKSYNKETWQEVARRTGLDDVDTAIFYVISLAVEEALDFETLIDFFATIKGISPGDMQKIWEKKNEEEKKVPSFITNYNKAIVWKTFVEVINQQLPDLIEKNIGGKKNVLLYLGKLHVPAVHNLFGSDNWQKLAYSFEPSVKDGGEAGTKYQVLSTENDGGKIIKDSRSEAERLKEAGEFIGFMDGAFSAQQEFKALDYAVTRKAFEKMLKRSWFEDKLGLIVSDVWIMSWGRGSGFKLEEDGLLYYVFKRETQFEAMKKVLVAEVQEGRMKWVLNNPKDALKVLDSIKASGCLTLDQAVKGTADAVLDIAKQIYQSGSRTVVMSGASTLLTYKLFKAAWENMFQPAPLRIHTLSGAENLGYQGKQSSINESDFAIFLSALVKDQKAQPIFYVDSHWQSGKKRERIQWIAGNELNFAVLSWPRENERSDSNLIGSTDPLQHEFISYFAMEVSRAIGANPVLNATRIDDSSMPDFEKKLNEREQKYLEMIVKAIQGNRETILFIPPELRGGGQQADSSAAAQDSGQPTVGREQKQDGDSSLLPAAPQDGGALLSDDGEPASGAPLGSLKERLLHLTSAGRILRHALPYDERFKLGMNLPFYMKRIAATDLYCLPSSVVSRADLPNDYPGFSGLGNVDDEKAKKLVPEFLRLVADFETWSPQNQQAYFEKTMAEASIDTVVIPDSEIFFVNSEYEGGKTDAVKLGFLKNGRPVVLKASYLQSKPFWTLKDYLGAQIAEALGFGPKVHGVYSTGEGKKQYRWIVMDLFPGDSPSAEEGKQYITDVTVAEFVTISQRLSQYGLVFGGSFQYLVNREGHIQLIDVGDGIRGVDSVEKETLVDSLLKLIDGVMEKEEMVSPRESLMSGKSIDQLYEEMNREKKFRLMLRLWMLSPRIFNQCLGTIKSGNQKGYPGLRLLFLKVDQVLSGLGYSEELGHLIFVIDDPQYAKKLLDWAKPYDKKIIPGEAIESYLNKRGIQKGYYYLDVSEISFQALPVDYSTSAGIRPFDEKRVRELLERNKSPLTIDESSFIEVKTPEQDTFLVSEESRGILMHCCSKAGFLPSGYPVALRTRVSEEGGEDSVLGDYREALLVDALGIGPKVHGLFRDAFGMLWMVTDMIPGDFPGTLASKKNISIDALNDLISIQERLDYFNLMFGVKFEYMVTPEGRVQVFPQKESIVPLKQPAGERAYFAEVMNLIGSAKERKEAEGSQYKLMASLAVNRRDLYESIKQWLSNENVAQRYPGLRERFDKFDDVFQRFEEAIRLEMGSPSKNRGDGNAVKEGALTRDGGESWEALRARGLLRSHTLKFLPGKEGFESELLNEVYPISIGSLPNGSFVVGDRGVYHGAAIYNQDGSVIFLRDENNRYLNLKEETVQQLTTDEQGNIYVATNKGIIRRYSGEGKLLGSYKINDEFLPRNSVFQVQGLIVFEGKLYFSIFDTGELRVLDLATGKERSFGHQGLYSSSHSMQLAINRKTGVIYIIGDYLDRGLRIRTFNVDNQESGEPKSMPGIFVIEEAAVDNNEVVYMIDTEKRIIWVLTPQGDLGYLPAYTSKRMTSIEVDKDNNLLIGRQGGFDIISQAAIKVMLVKVRFSQDAPAVSIDDGQVGIEKNDALQLAFTGGPVLSNDGQTGRKESKVEDIRQRKDGEQIEEIEIDASQGALLLKSKLNLLKELRDQHALVKIDWNYFGRPQSKTGIIEYIDKNMLRMFGEGTGIYYRDIKLITPINHNYEVVTQYIVEKAGLDWYDVSRKLIENGWGYEISWSAVFLRANLEQESDRMSKVFGDSFSKVLMILQQSYAAKPLEEIVVRKNLNKLLGVKIGSKVISVGPQDSYFIREAQGRAVKAVAWERLFLSAGAEVTVFEPEKEMNINKKWQDVASQWTREGDNIIVMTPENARFEQSKLEDRSVDVVVMMSVLSAPTIFDDVKDQIALTAARVLRPGGYLIVGWYNSPSLIKSDYKDTEEQLEKIRKQGYILEEVTRGSEPQDWYNSHDWVCYRVLLSNLLVGGEIEKGLREAERDGGTTKAEEEEVKDGGVGGIDFRNLPVIVQPASVARPGLSVSIQPKIPLADLDKEWNRIRELVNKGDIPSGAKIKEYVISCCQKGNMNADIQKILACISDILRLEEDYVIVTEPGFLQLLTVLESDKSGQELQLALSAVSFTDSVQ